MHNPDLIPVDDMGMSAPLTIVARETRSESGSADLIAVSREGYLLLVKFVHGFRDTDSSGALSQLLGNGSDLWGLR